MLGDKRCKDGHFFYTTGGQKARVVFAELACREPDVLILVSELDSTYIVWDSGAKNDSKT